MYGRPVQILLNIYIYIVANIIWQLPTYSYFPQHLNEIHLERRIIITWLFIPVFVYIVLPQLPVGDVLGTSAYDTCV